MDREFSSTAYSFQLNDSRVAFVGMRGDGGTSHDQGGDEGAEEGFAAAPGVVHELEEAEV